MHLDFFLYLFIFVFGTIVGSFLNVVALRYNTGLPIARGRSQCFSCGKNLEWYELIPVLSFIFLRGRCSECKSAISWQYPSIEFITGALFLAAFIRIGFSEYLLYYLCFIALLIVISIYDIRHKIIPNDLVYLFSGLALLMCLHMWMYADAEHVLLDLSAGPILALPFALLWLISQGRWIGLGDAKLALGIGFMLGLVHGISAIVLAFWMGAAWSIVALLLSKKRLTMKSEIPFGPFLVIGTLIIFLFGWDVIGISSLLGL